MAFLWWDSHLQESAWKRFSEEIRGIPFSSEEMKIHVHGRTNQHSIEYLIGMSITGDELDRVTQQKESIYRQMCLEQGDDFRLSSGAIEFLDYLVVNDVARTIATASERTNLDFFIDHLQLTTWFNLEQIVYDDGTRLGKPEPDIYVEAAKRLGLNPAQCVVIEDSHSGIKSAYAAEIGHIIALGPEEAHRELNELAGVSRVIESFERFPKEELFGL